jgi:hypothetical protein
MEQVNYIEGPIRLILLYSKKLDLYVYLFGDWHVKLERECKHHYRMNIAEFLHQTMLLQLDEPIDLFLESWYQSKSGKLPVNEKNDEEGFLFSDVWTKFQVLNQDEISIKYGQNRVHNADVRSIVRFPQDSDTKQQKLLRDLRSKVNSHSSDINTILETQILLNQLSFDDLLDCCKGVKQFFDDAKKSRNDTSLKIYITWKYKFPNAIKEINEMVKEMKEKIKSLNLIGYSDHIIWSNYVIKFYKAVKYILNLPMDFYLIGRLLRFSKNAIIYAGDWHIGNYVYTLKHIGGFDIIKYTPSLRIQTPFVFKNKNTETSQCLDIRGWDIPFFSMRPLKPRITKQIKRKREDEENQNLVKDKNLS